MPRVLFLEDEPHLVETLPAILEDIDNRWQVIGFTDINNALDHLRKEAFDAVLLDISMPPTETMDSVEVEHGRLTGIAVAKSIKEIKPEIPIVALTVISDLPLKDKMKDVGIAYTINKPAEIDEIAQTLLRVIR